MRRRRKTSKFYKRSFSKPMFDPQRLLYFSTNNQRQGKVIRPKSYAVGTSPTQSVKDQEEVLENLNNTKMFRTINEKGSNYYYTTIVNRQFQVGALLPFNNEADKTTNACFYPTDFETEGLGGIDLYSHSFYPFTPNQFNIFAAKYTFTIDRHNPTGTGADDIQVILNSGIRDMSGGNPDFPFENVTLFSFNYLDEVFEDTINTIKLEITPINSIHVTKPLTVDDKVLWRNFPDPTNLDNYEHDSDTHSVTFKNNSEELVDFSSGQKLAFLEEQEQRCNPNNSNDYYFMFNGIGRNNQLRFYYYIYANINQQPAPQQLPYLDIHLEIEYVSMEEYPILTRT